MRMSQYSNINHHEPERANNGLPWTCWAEFSGEVDEAKRMSILSSCIRVNSYELLRNLTAPKSPKEKWMVDFTSILKAHFEPMPSRTVLVSLQRSSCEREYSWVCGRAEEADNWLQVWWHKTLFGGVPTWPLWWWIANWKYKKEIINRKETYLR